MVVSQATLLRLAKGSLVLGLVVWAWAFIRGLPSNSVDAPSVIAFGLLILPISLAVALDLDGVSREYRRWPARITDPTAQRRYARWLGVLMFAVSIGVVAMGITLANRFGGGG
jgi:hypothetical protein